MLQLLNPTSPFINFQYLPINFNALRLEDPNNLPSYTLKVLRGECEDSWACS